MKKKSFLLFALVMFCMPSILKAAEREQEYAVWSVIYNEGSTRTLFVVSVSVVETDDDLKPKILWLPKSCPRVSGCRMPTLGVGYSFDCSGVVSSCNAVVVNGGREAQFGFNYNFALVIRTPDWGQEPLSGSKLIRVSAGGGVGGTH